MTNHQANGWHKETCECTACVKYAKEKAASLERPTDLMELSITVKSPSRSKSYTVSKINLPVGFFNEMKADADRMFAIMVENHLVRHQGLYPRTAIIYNEGENDVSRPSIDETT